MGSSLTQQDAASILGLAGKWARAVDDRHYAIPNLTTAVAREKNAEQALNVLIASLTADNGE